MKQLIKVGIISMFLIGLGLLIWTSLPKSKVKEAITINPNYSLFSGKLECSHLQDLMESKINVEYPKAIRYKESGEILVIFEKLNYDTGKSVKANSSGSCTVSLEARIEMKGVLLEPVNRRIESYLNDQTQMFMFKITPLATYLEKGTIWIYVVTPNEKDARLERIPLLAIPFSIQVESLFKIPPKIIRIFAILLISLILLLLFLQMDQNKNRK